jgi:hypothetical protein
MSRNVNNHYMRSGAMGQRGPIRRQSPALCSPLPEFVLPTGQRGQDILIIWDFQNVRTPDELEPAEVLR